MWHSSQKGIVVPKLKTMSLNARSQFLRAQNWKISEFLEKLEQCHYRIKKKNLCYFQHSWTVVAALGPAVSTLPWKSLCLCIKPSCLCAGQGSGFIDLQLRLSSCSFRIQSYITYTALKRKKEQKSLIFIFAQLRLLSSEESLSLLEAIKMFPYNFFPGPSLSKPIRCCTCSSNKTKQQFLPQRVLSQIL